MYIEQLKPMNTRIILHEKLRKKKTITQL